MQDGGEVPEELSIVEGFVYIDERAVSLDYNFDIKVTSKSPDPDYLYVESDCELQQKL